MSDAPAPQPAQPAEPGPAAHPRPGAIVVMRWLCRMAIAFLVVSAVLIAGFAPYSSDMGAILLVSGILLLGALSGYLADKILGWMEPRP